MKASSPPADAPTPTIGKGWSPGSLVTGMAVRMRRVLGATGALEFGEARWYFVLPGRLPFFTMPSRRPFDAALLFRDLVLPQRRGVVLRCRANNLDEPIASGGQQARVSHHRSLANTKRCEVHLRNQPGVSAAPHPGWGNPGECLVFRTDCRLSRRRQVVSGGAAFDALLRGSDDSGAFR